MCACDCVCMGVVYFSFIITRERVYVVFCFYLFIFHNYFIFIFIYYTFFFCRGVCLKFEFPVGCRFLRVFCLCWLDLFVDFCCLFTYLLVYLLFCL